MSAPPAAALVEMAEGWTVARLLCDTAVARRPGLRRGAKAACTPGRCRSAGMLPADHASVCARGDARRQGSLLGTRQAR